MGFFNLFTSKMTTAPTRAVVMDNKGSYPIHKDYEKAGIESNLLEFIGFHRDENEILVFVYRIK